MRTKCAATTTSGARCAAQPVRPSGYCYWHDPALARQRQDNNRRGGHARSNRARARKETALTDGDLLVTLSRAIRKVEREQMAPGILSAIANAARTMVAIRSDAELERRVIELEERAATQAVSVGEARRFE